METVSKLILAFVTLIVGIVMLTQISTTTQGVTTTTSVTNESLAITAARVAGNQLNSSYVFRPALYTVANQFGKQDASECLVGSNGGFSLANSSGSVKTLNTDYVINSDGSFRLLNSSTGLNNSVTNTTYIAYTYCPDGYVSQGFGRTAINLNVGLFAIAILAVSIGLFYSVYKDFKD